MAEEQKQGEINNAEEIIIDKELSERISHYLSLDGVNLERKWELCILWGQVKEGIVAVAVEVKTLNKWISVLFLKVKKRFVSYLLSW